MWEITKEVIHIFQPSWKLVGLIQELQINNQRQILESAACFFRQN